MMEDAWALILQHASICENAELVCGLLCTSKALRDAVDTHCAGLLPLSFEKSAKHGTVADENQPFEQFTQLWLPKHAHILKELTVETARGAATLAIGLQQAAASRNLKLQHYCNFNGYGFGECTVLQQLPCSHLTCLDLAIRFDDAEYQQNMAAALQRLTALRCVNLWDKVCVPLAEAISGHQHLTRVCLDPFSVLMPLPACVQQLVLAGRYCASDEQRRQRPPLQLGPLTATTLLKISGDATTELPLMPDDVLPPNLKVLEARVDSVQPLLALQRLCTLKLACMGSATAAAQLVQLSNLRQLTALELEYTDSEQGLGQPLAAAWAVLPVVKLEGACLHDADVPHLGRLQSLTYLGLTQGNTSLASTGTLAAAVAQLTQLQELKLVKLWDLDDDLTDTDVSDSDEDRAAAAANAAAAEQFLQAVGRLPLLQSLTVEQPNLGTTAVHLGAASALTRLCLMHCDLVDYSVVSLAYQLSSATGLQSLELSRNRQLSDAVLPVIARELQHLTHLGISYTAATDQGVQWLTALQQLESLYVFGSRVPVGVANQVLHGT